MKTASKPRNAFAVAAKRKKAGKIKPRKDKRKNGKNKQQEMLKEADND